MMKGLCLFLLCFLLTSNFIFGQEHAIGHFDQKIEGEDLNYFSPLHEFASLSLLTRCNGESPIAFSAEQFNTKTEFSKFQFLIGYSSGTSGGERAFDVYLNDHFLFTIKTQPKQKGFEPIQWYESDELKSDFQCSEYDINGDAFGEWNIQVPSKWVKKKAEFKIYGKSLNSRDWLMVFQYRPQFEIKVNVTPLVFRDNQERLLQISANQIEEQPIRLKLSSRHWATEMDLKKGYNLLSIPSYPIEFSGKDTMMVAQIRNGQEISIQEIPLEINPVRHFEMNIIHHSHNDIGYSHHQTEVEKIQTRNIRSALRWIQKAKQDGMKAYWHIESLWAVENFYKTASPSEIENFKQAVRDGHIVLSANYANILTGLCAPEELPWMVEYAQGLEHSIPCEINNAMITDIPGITYSALKNYVDHHIPYLALGPNYVEKHIDHGDRVGRVIEQTGDKYFYWYPNEESKDRLLVWTAGKGYSYFHNIQDNEKQFQWEKRIAQYVQELQASDYPLDFVQLRYTKNADNGPVDSTLHTFVRQWNEKYSSPTLVIASVNQLFQMLQKEDSIPNVYGGEISPYWEDGAYSTSREEIQTRQLVQELLALEKHWNSTEREKSKNIDFYPIHRDVVLFHEHTWGSWCSVSDPYSDFTTDQWNYKKSFLTDAQEQLTSIKKMIEQSSQYIPKENPIHPDLIHDQSLFHYEIDTIHGGITSLYLKDGTSIPLSEAPLFAPLYRIGLSPTLEFQPTLDKTVVLENDSLQTTFLHGQFDDRSPMEHLYWQYRLNKKTGKLHVHVEIIKSTTLNKESLHFPINIGIPSPQVTFGSAQLRYPEDQLPGSNREFICTDGPLILKGSQYQWHMDSRDIALIEIGGPIDETQSMGAKVWKRNPQPTQSLYLYAFNNYWHTNYKAEQGDEPIVFDVEFWIEEKQ
jgi:hypothetical protein